MADRNAALQQFLSITGVNDTAAAQSILEAANWDVDVRFSADTYIYHSLASLFPEIFVAQLQVDSFLLFLRLP